MHALPRTRFSNLNKGEEKIKKMLGIGFAMLIIDLSVSNLPLFLFVAFTWASPLGTDSSLI